MEDIKQEDIKQPVIKKRRGRQKKELEVKPTVIEKQVFKKINETRDAHIEVNLLMPGKSGQSYRIEIPNISGVTTGTMRNPDNFIGIITDAIKSRFPKAVIK